MSHRKKILISALVIFILFLVTMYILLFSNADYKLTAKPSIEAYDTFMDAKYAGNTVKLNEDEFNSILSMIFEKGIIKGDITVYGAEAKIKSSQIYLYSPISFKGIKMLVSAFGNVSEDADNIIFKPAQIKLGHISLPLHYLLSKLTGNKISFFEFTSDSIIINKSSLSMNIKNVSAEDNKMVISFQAVKLPVINPPVTQQPSVTVNIPQEKPNTTKTKPTAPVWQGDLKKLSSQLSSAINLVEGYKEKNILSRVKSSVDKKIASPSYDISGDAASVLNSYGKLSLDQVNHIKGAILATVDLENAMSLRQIFGI